MSLIKFGSNVGLIKQASLNKIASEVPEFQNTTDKISAKKDDNFVYFWTRAVTAEVPNLNCDIFPLDELKKAYPTFIGRGLYLDHNASSVANAVGKIFDAKLLEDPTATDEEGKYYVGCLCGVDKTTHPDIAKKVAHGVIDSVSMGASVLEAECSICGAKASTPEDFCIHLQNQGKIDPETGKKCCSINRGVNFTELSLVSVPADPMAKTQQVFASFIDGIKKNASATEKLQQKFSFSIPCGNDKICEMLYNLLDGYKKHGIMDLVAEGPVLKLSVKADNELEALNKLESISQEQGLDIEKPLEKEENSMPNEEIKTVEDKVGTDTAIENMEDASFDKKADGESEFDTIYNYYVNGNITEYKAKVNELFKQGPTKVVEFMNYLDEVGANSKELLSLVASKEENLNIEASDNKQDEVESVKEKENKEELEKQEEQEKKADFVPSLEPNKEAVVEGTELPVETPIQPEAKPEPLAPVTDKEPLNNGPKVETPELKPGLPPAPEGQEKLDTKPALVAKEIKTKEDAIKALEDVIEGGEKADKNCLDEILNFLKSDKGAKEEKPEEKKEDKKEDKKEEKQEEKKEEKTEVKNEPAKEEKPEEKKAEEETPIETKAEDEVMPTFANVTRVSLLKTANLLDSKWVFHFGKSNKVATLSVSKLLPGVSEKLAYLTSKDFYDQMVDVLKKKQSFNDDSLKDIVANFNEKVKVGKDETKSQVAKSTSKVKVETDGEKVSNSGKQTQTNMTDDGKAQKQDKVNSNEEAGAVETASKKAPAETDMKVRADFELKLKQLQASLEAKESELNQVKLQRELDNKTAKCRNIVEKSIRCGLVKCNEQYRQEELLKQASPLKAKEEAMKRTAESMVSDLLALSDEELDRQMSYLSNFKVEAEVKQLKPIKIDDPYDSKSEDQQIIEAIVADMM